MSDFHAMRARLIERGLVHQIGDEFRLTDAGARHARAMLWHLRQPNRSMGGTNDNIVAQVANSDNQAPHP